jgi:polar amino acid transport system permease protein
VTYNWDFAVILPYLRPLANGLLVTLQLVIVSLVLGLGSGLVVGLMKYSRRPLLNWPAALYIELFRNVPVLVQLVWFFYAFPILIGAELSAFVAGVMALSLNTSAFSAELFRGGIQSIGRGQREAGRALGMSGATLMRRIILPQAIKRMIPPLTNRAIELAKMTALASTIAVPELLYQGRLINAVTFRPIETYTVVAVVYLVILWAATIGVDRLERRLRRSD